MLTYFSFAPLIVAEFMNAERVFPAKANDIQRIRQIDSISRRKTQRGA